MARDQLSVLRPELGVRPRRRDEVITLNTENMCEVTSQIATPIVNDGNAMGVMFSIDNTQGIIELQTLEFYTAETNQKITADVFVYTKTGFFVGLEEQPGLWEEIASVTLTLAQPGKPTIIPQKAFKPITLQSNTRQSFYIALNSSGIQFSNIKDPAQSVGSAYISDDFLTISTGVSLSDHFVYNARHQRYPRLFNGGIYYSRQLNCTEAKDHKTFEYNYTLETPANGIVLTPISEAVKNNVETVIATNSSTAKYGRNEMLTLDGVRSQANSLQASCPNQWKSCFQLTTEVSFSSLDFPTSGKIFFDLLGLQPIISGDLRRLGLNVKYVGSTPLSYNYTFFLNGVPNDAALDDVEASYFERITLQFLRAELSNLTSATVLAIEVIGKGTYAGSGERHQRDRRRNQQSNPATGVLQLHTTIYGMVQLPETLTPLDRALADVFDKRSDDLANDLSSQIFQPGTISQGGEGNVFAQLFSVRIENPNKNKTGIFGSSEQPTSSNDTSNDKILGMSTVWFVVLCAGVIVLMGIWLAYVNVRDRREYRQWRRLVAREEKRKKKNNHSLVHGNNLPEDEIDFESQEGLLTAGNDVVSTDGWTAAESFDSLSPCDSGSTGKLGSILPRELEGEMSSMQALHSRDQTEMESTPSNPNDNVAILQQAATRLDEINCVERTEVQEQSSVIAATPTPRPALTSETDKTEEREAVANFPNNSFYQGDESSQIIEKPKKKEKKKMAKKKKDKISKEVSNQRHSESTEINGIQDAVSVSGITNELVGTSRIPTVDTAEEVADVAPASFSSLKKEIRVEANATIKANAVQPTPNSSLPEGDIRLHPPIENGKTKNMTKILQPPSPQSDIEVPSELQNVRARVTRTEIPLPSQSTGTTSIAPLSSSSVVAYTKLDEILPSKVGVQPSELDRMRAKVMKTNVPTVAEMNKHLTKSSAAEDFAFPKGSISKVRDLFDKKTIVSDKSCKPCPSATPLKNAVKGRSSPQNASSSNENNHKNNDAFTAQVLTVLKSNNNCQAIITQLKDQIRSIPTGREKELLDIILVCCAQEPRYENKYGQLAEQLCSIMQVRWNRTLENGFSNVFHSISRYTMLSTTSSGQNNYSSSSSSSSINPKGNSGNTAVRNVAKFFAHLLETECIPWSVLRILHDDNHDDHKKQGRDQKHDTSISSTTTSSSECRLFVKTLVQAVAKAQQRKDSDGGHETDDDVSNDGLGCEMQNNARAA